MKVNTCGFVTSEYLLRHNNRNHLANKYDQLLRYSCPISNHIFITGRIMNNKQPLITDKEKVLSGFSAPNRQLQVKSQYHCTVARQQSAVRPRSDLLQQPRAVASHYTTLARLCRLSCCWPGSDEILQRIAHSTLVHSRHTHCTPGQHAVFLCPV